MATSWSFSAACGAPQKAGERLGDILLWGAEKNSRAIRYWILNGAPQKTGERLGDFLC
jgi:hypothetical protein